MGLFRDLSRPVGLLREPLGCLSRVPVVGSLTAPPTRPDYPVEEVG